MPAGARAGIEDGTASAARALQQSPGAARAAPSVAHRAARTATAPGDVIGRVYAIFTMVTLALPGIHDAVSPFASPPPQVALVNAFARPFDNAVATARTCYSGK